MPFTRRPTVTLLLLGLLLVPTLAGPQQPQQERLWQALAERKAFAMIRHALAPGTGDPADFEIGDCSTQRNLSQAGREQARAIGQRFRANGIDRAEVRSSQWCRCLDTARLLDLGPVEEMPALNSFFGDRSRGPAQLEAIRAFVGDWRRDQPLVLVTHQVNITGLTDVFPRSGEIIVVRPGGGGEMEVLGTIETAA